MRQDEDTRSQLNRNFDAIRSLLFTKEYINAGFEIWDASMSLSPTIVTGSHARWFMPVGSYGMYLKILGFPWQGLGYIRTWFLYTVYFCVSPVRAHFMNWGSSGFDSWSGHFSAL